jgi:streptogramin lyase
MEIDEQLREAGERWRAAERAPAADFRRATQRPSRSSRTPGRSRGLLAVPILVVAFVLAFAVVFFAQSNSSSTKVTVTQPTTPTSTAPGPPTALTLDPAIARTGALAIDGASVWVTGEAPRSRAATLEHIDTKTGNLIGKVVLRDNSPFQIVVGDGAVWVCSQQNEESAHVTKVDPTTMRITAVIETAGDAAVAVTPDAVWVDHGSGNLARLDPATNKVLATIPLPGAPSGYTAHFITASPLGIFLANTYDGTVLRVDPATNTVKVLADVGNYAGEIVELDGSLWVNTSRTLVEIDPNTGALIRTIPRSIRDIGFDGTSLWATTNRPEVLRIDPRTGRAQTLSLPSGMKFAIALAADPETGAVWAADSPAQRLVRLAP